jgi:cellulose synthase/poly-beta-1,6-N-acetylglucosamine synthase-like glycosyltransferase
VKVTVLILTSGTRDKHVLIEGLLRSLARQTIKPYEVIIATETSGEELAKMASKHLSGVDLKVLETGYWNKCWTANRAILESEGDVIFLLEDDLYLAPNFIEEVLNAFKEYPEAGCIYTRCVWVFREGARSRGGLLGWLAKTLSKLTIHESVLPKMVVRVNNHLIEVPVFTMSVACRKEALLKAGLYDMRVKEPILGEDYDLALRVRKAGYRIVQTSRAVSYHLTRQVSKGVARYSKDPSKLMGAYETEVYFMAKNRDVLGVANVVGHAVYRAIEAVAWGSRSKNPRTILYGIAGSIKGFVKGIILTKPC